MSKTPGDKIIEEVSMPLAKTIFQTDFESETGEALRAKTLELLLALDIVASASHDIKQISDRSLEFKQQFEDKFQTNYMKQTAYDEFQTYRTLEAQASEWRALQPRISGVSRVENGTITEVTTISPDGRSSNPTQAPFLPDSHAAEMEKQTTFRSDSLKTIQNDIHNPLNQITTIKRIGNKNENPDTSLSRSFITDSSFKGVLNDTDRGTISNFVNKNKITVQTSEKSDTDYLKTLTEKSNKNENSRNLSEEKHSGDIETETSKETSPAQAATPSAPAVMVTGGGGGGGGASFGGGAFGRSGGGRQNASFGRNKKSSDDIKSTLENSKVDDEIDIDKLLSDMLNENKENEEKTLDSTTSKLPEGSYTVVDGPDGEPLGYKVSKELGGGVFLFDSDTGKSTALTMTTKDNVFLDPETGQYYQMDFPDSDNVTDENTGATENNSAETGSATLSPIESDAEPIKKEIDFSNLNQDMLDSQGLSRINIDGEYYYASFDENGNIDTLVDTNGKLVDNVLQEDGVEVFPEKAETELENATSRVEIPPSLSEIFNS